jgi:hypothetical protein
MNLTKGDKKYIFRVLCEGEGVWTLQMTERLIVDKEFSQRRHTYTQILSCPDLLGFGHLYQNQFFLTYKTANSYQIWTGENLCEITSPLASVCPCFFYITRLINQPWNMNQFSYQVLILNVLCWPPDPWASCRPAVMWLLAMLTRENNSERLLDTISWFKYEFDGFSNYVVLIQNLFYRVGPHKSVFFIYSSARLFLPPACWW